jgi:flagellar biosynthesis protein FlhF
MKAKRFTARNMQQALRMVSDELGPDAVILSNKRVAKGVEVVAALDFQELAQDQQQQELDRQLALQQELENAKQATQQIRDEGPQVLNQALSDTSALKHMLTDLKQQLHDESPIEGVVPAFNTQTKSATEEAEPASITAPHNTAASVSDELNDLKNWLISQQGNAWNPTRPMNWQQAQIWQRCQDLGIDPSWADKLVSHLPEDENIEKSWAACLQLIAEDMPLASNNMLHAGGIYAFVGPTGAGKTTTIGKLAAQFVMNHGNDQVAMVTLDNYRIAAHDQLKAFARIMEVPLHIVPPNGNLAELLESLQDRKFILIDTAGLASQDPHFSVQLSMLKQVGRKVKTLLTLPLTSQARCLQENFEHFKDAGIDGCVFTKLDECFSLGQAMSIAAVTRLPVHMVTDGPHIPDDIHFPDAKKMVRLAEQMARMAQTRWQTSELSSANSNNIMQHGA